MDLKSFFSFKRTLFLLFFLFILSGLFLFFRGPYISDNLKKLILPEISAATGRDVTAQKIYINILPLFIEARDIKVFDKKGDLSPIVFVPRIKGYVSISAFLRKEINIRRLVIDSPELKSDMTVLEDIVGKISEYLRIQKRFPFKVKVKNINLSNGRVDLAYRGSSIRLKGANSDVIIRGEGPDGGMAGLARVNLSVKNTELSLKGWPLLTGSLRSLFFLYKDSVDLRTIEVKVDGSGISSSGLFPFELRDGEMRLRLGILIETLKRFFGLRNRGEGEIKAEGILRFLKGVEGIKADPFGSLFIDLDLKGSLYIESLLELVRVKEDIRGAVDFSGNLKGPLKSLTGQGEAVMKNGNLFGVAVRTLRCDVGYKEGMLNLTNGKAPLYNGTASAMAVVQLVGGDFYSVDIKAEGVDSIPLLDLIGWRPDIPPGKIRGEFKTSGSEFAPSGWFEYSALTHKGDYILKKVRSIKGSYTMQRDILTLHDARAETRASGLIVNGDIDISSSKLDLRTELQSEDINEISSPFLRDLAGAGRFMGIVKGSFNDPLISGQIVAKASFGHHDLGQVRTEIDYRKNELIIKDLLSKKKDSELRIRGSIVFSGARELFDLKNPDYNLLANVRNIDLIEVRPLLHRLRGLEDVSISGCLDADLSIKGTIPELKGSIRVSKPVINRIILNSASTLFVYDEGQMRFKDIEIKRSLDGRESVIHGEGVVYSDETVQFRLEGGVFINDISRRADFPLGGVLDFKVIGKGKIINPEVDVTANLIKGTIKKVNIGGGKIKASLREKGLTFETFLFDEKAVIKGRLDLRDLSYNAWIELRSGRYDRLVSAFLKDVPEDLLLNLRGHIDITGKGEHFSVKGLIDEMNITLYGYSFSSERDIIFSMRDWRITIPPVKIRSGVTSFNIHGVVDINREIDISMEGSSNLSPLKGLSRKIDAIKGESEFVLSISGRWDSPRINGGVSISNAFLGIKGIPHRLSGANGYLYIDEDRIIIDKLSGKVGGGDIHISGITYLEGFRLKRFYIDSIVNDVTLNLSRDFPVNFNGNLFLRGTGESRSLSGEIRIKRARYKERVEWKSWLLKAKGVERPKGEIGVFEDTVLNIKVYGYDDVVIDNNIARSQVRLDILLRGTVLQPVILGRVEAIGGTVYFRNNEFRIVKASADFSDPKRVNPVMEIVAETNVKGYNIRLNLEGQMEHFNLSLISDPPLPEIDILSLLTVGKFGKELKGIESGIGAGEATSFLTGKMQDIIEERVRSLTGLDRLEVDPYVSKTTGTVSPRITVSKRLLGDRLFVTYSSAVGTAENNVLRLEYILNKNVSLVGVRDEKGSIGGDIKFRFEFK